MFVCCVCCQWRTQEFCFRAPQREGGSKNSGEDTGHLGAVTPLLGVPLNLQMGETHIYYVVTDAFSTELGIRLIFVKTLEFRAGG
jgi:hypothetical protein